VFLKTLSFAADFLQIPPRDGHPCLELMVGTINPHIELSPTSNHPCWAHIKKPFSLIAKGLRISKLPLLETFGTFCWGEIIEELQNTYKLKELINLPVRVLNNI